MTNSEDNISKEHVDDSSSEKGAGEKKPRLFTEEDPVKKAMALGVLALGIYAMDRLVGEEKKIYLSDNKYIKVKKGFLEEFFE